MTAVQKQYYSVSIQLGNETKVYSVDFQTNPEFAAAWKGVLKQAHGRARVTCLCPGWGLKQLAVKYISDLDIFYLSKYPDSGYEHDPSCRFHEASTSLSDRSQDRDAIERLPDGTVKVKLRIGIQERSGAKGLTVPLSTRSDKRTRKTATALLKLLHLLWVKAGLNEWQPGCSSRSLNFVSESLRRSASGIKIGFTPLSEVLCLTSSSEGSNTDRTNRNIVKACIQGKKRLIVVAPLAGYSEERRICATGYLPIYGFWGIPFLKISRELWDTTVKSFPHAVTMWRHGYRVMTITQTDTPVSEQIAVVVDIALMPVSVAWIPIDSIVEGRVEEKLRGENRRFYKPLLYDTKDITFPDFVLTDTERDTPMEVFGLDTPDYVEHKQKKIEHYNRIYGDNWWCWDSVAEPDCIPAFPER